MKLISAFSLLGCLFLAGCASKEPAPVPPPTPEATPWAQLHMAELTAIALEEKYEIENNGEEIRLIIPVNGNFHPKRTLLLPSGLVPLSRVAKVLRGATDSNIHATGRRDTPAERHLPPQPSTHRPQRSARAVASVLQLGGVSRHNMQLRSEGEAAPRADNSTVEGRELNRRVVINITPRNPASSIALAP